MPEFSSQLIYLGRELAHEVCYRSCILNKLYGIINSKLQIAQIYFNAQDWQKSWRTRRFL